MCHLRANALHKNTLKVRQISFPEAADVSAGFHTMQEFLG
jgi:hypothetical protein